MKSSIFPNNLYVKKTQSTIQENHYILIVLRPTCKYHEVSFPVFTLNSMYFLPLSPHKTIGEEAKPFLDKILPNLTTLIDTIGK